MTTKTIAQIREVKTEWSRDEVMALFTLHGVTVLSEQNFRPYYILEQVKELLDMNLSPAAIKEMIAVMEKKLP